MDRWSTPLVRSGRLALAALLASCSPKDPTAPQFVILEVVSGNNQTGFVGATLPQPLVVQARSERGEPVPGVRLSWTVLTGGGTVTASSSETGPDGQATADFRLGSSLGAQAAQAFAFETEGAPVRFDATATPAPASVLTLVSGGGQTATVGATLPQDIVIRLNDAFGNVVPGTTVTFTVLSGGGTTNVPSAVSDNGGLVRFRWTLGPEAGTQTVAAAVFGVAPLGIEATARAGSPSQILVQSGSQQSAPPGAELPDPLVAVVTDQFGNAIANVTVTWTPVGAGGGTVNPTTSQTNQDGEATTRWTLGPKGGSKTVRATASGVSAAAGFEGAGQIIFSTVSAGGFHTCGFDQAGGAYCWGLFGDGQLGIGAAPSGSGPAFPAPQAVAQGSNIFSTAAGASGGGGSHSCAVALSLDAYCWGKNSDGRLGTGGTSNANSPAKVLGSGYRSITTGDFHTCAVTSGDRLYCWGLNNEGQIGSAGNTTAPVAILSSQTFTSLAAGGLHTCAIQTGGAAWCWGSNGKGQLGSATAGGVTAEPVEGGLLFASVVAGESHTCALTADGAAYCWGDNDAGQLGEDPLLVPTRALPGPAAPGFSFVALTAGLDHTCGITAGGLAYCWGRNSSGELGDETTASSSTPVAVGGGYSFARLSAGDRHTCGVTLEGVVYCWGSNQFGQIGNSSTDPLFRLPTKVSYQP